MKVTVGGAYVCGKIKRFRRKQTDQESCVAREIGRAGSLGKTLEVGARPAFDFNARPHWNRWLTIVVYVRGAARANLLRSYPGNAQNHDNTSEHLPSMYLLIFLSKLRLNGDSRPASGSSAGALSSTEEFYEYCSRRNACK